MSITYATALLKVEQDLDLEEENFIQASEMLGYFNEGIRECEAEILTINEDYFLTKANLALVLGTSLYSLPAGIYASKIRAIIYSNGTIIYPIERLRSARRFLDRALLIYASPTDYYKYLLLNASAASSAQIELTPPSKENSATNVTIWFIREVVELVLTTDVIDIPEFINFIYAFVKGRCKQKENAGVMPGDAQQEIEHQRKMMVDTLSNRVPDDDTEIVKDISFYQESS